MKADEMKRLSKGTACFLAAVQVCATFLIQKNYLQFLLLKYWEADLLLTSIIGWISNVAKLLIVLYSAELGVEHPRSVNVRSLL